VFIGEYNHTIDSKRRIAIPSKFRARFKKGAVVTRGLDNCLFVYPIDTWKEIAEKLGTMPIGERGTRSFVRLVLAGAFEAEVDSQGRILLPESLVLFAGLGKRAVVAGLFNRLEVWDEKRWNNFKKVAEKNQDKIADELGKLGIF